MARDGSNRSSVWCGASLVCKGLFLLFVFVGLSIFIATIIFSFRGLVFLPVVSLRVLGWGLLLLFLLWFFYMLISWPWRRMHRHYEKEIARRRYARGEITRRQYLEIIKELKNTED